MKKILSSFTTSLFLFASVFSFQEAFADYASTPQVKIFGGNVVTVWQDFNYTTSVPAILVASGTASTNPSTWTTTSLTDPSISSISPPKVFSNVGGDILIIWEEADSSYNYSLQAAVLPVGTTTFNVQTISLSTEQAFFNDATASVEADGVVYVVYTSQDNVTGNVTLKGVTTTISATPVWSTSAQISS